MYSVWKCPVWPDSLTDVFPDMQVNTLVEYYRQLAQKEKLEREKKKLTKRRNYMHLSVSN